MDKLLKDTIENYTSFKNTPDDVFFCDWVYDYDNTPYKKVEDSEAVRCHYNCFPFTYVKTLDKVYVGESFTIHHDLEHQILYDLFKKWTPLQLHNMFKNTFSYDLLGNLKKIYKVYDDNQYFVWRDELIDTHEILNDLDGHFIVDTNLFWEVFPVNVITFRGRIYEIQYNNKKYVIITCWNLVNGQGQFENIDNLIKRVIDKIDYDLSSAEGVYVAGGDGPMQVWSSKEPVKIDMEDLSNEENIHLANQQKKKEFFKQFLANRDTKNVKKYGSLTPIEWRRLRYGYIDENIKTKKRIRLTESQIKEIIKNEIKK